MLNEFISYLEEQVKNHSIYIWGGQGQSYPTVNEAWIKKKESGTNLKKALETYKKAVEAGCRERLKAFDCSGLGMYWLRDIKNIYPSDLNSNGMLSKCIRINKEQLKKGDWVFRTYRTGSKKGRAYHIGYIVDGSLNVIEAKGRAYGVIKSGFDPGYWNTYARPTVFLREIAGTDENAVNITRNVKYGCIGRDVMLLQALVGADCDGVFGSRTRAAVKSCQGSAGLKKDGIIGINTVSALGGSCKREDILKIGTFNVKRGKGSKSVYKKIADAMAECDICGFQEVTKACIPHMTAKKHYLCPTVGSYGHAAATDLEPSDTRVYELPAGGEKRRLQYLRLSRYGKTIGYYNTHIQFTGERLPEINITQMKKVRDILNEDKNDIKILTGDFNCSIAELKSVFEPAGYRILNGGEKYPAPHVKSCAAYPMDNIIIKGADVRDRWVYPAITKKLSDHDAFFAEVVL